MNFAETQYAPEVFEAVLFGLGGMTPVAFLQTAGVQLDLKGEPVTDAAHESSVPKLYIIGDLIGHGHGGGSIISGFNSASRAVRHLLERYLKWPLPPGNGFARPSAQLAFLIWAHTTIVGFRDSGSLLDNSARDFRVPQCSTQVNGVTATEACCFLFSLI